MTLRTERLRTLEQFWGFLDGNESAGLRARRPHLGLRLRAPHAGPLRGTTASGGRTRGLVKRFIEMVTGFSRAQPRPDGRPGHLRVDTVHLGDRDNALVEAKSDPRVNTLAGCPSPVFAEDNEPPSTHYLSLARTSPVTLQSSPRSGSSPGWK